MTSQTEDSRPNRLTRMERRWLVGLAVPSLLTVSIIVLTVVLTVYSAWAYQRSAPGSAYGPAVTDQATIYDDNTSTDHSARWRILANAAIGLDLRFDGLLEPTRTAEVGQQYSAESQPLISELKRLVMDKTPVWDASAVGPYWQSELHDAVPYVELLETEFHTAVAHNDADHAQQILQLLVDMGSMLDYSASFNYYLWHATTSSAHQRLIAFSLAAGFWKEPDQLTELEIQLAAFQELSADRAGLPAPWNHRSTSDVMMLRSRDEYSADPADRPLTTKLVNIVTGGGFVPEFELDRQSTDAAVKALEVDYRLARTAIAVKKFRLLENRWPDFLDQLESVGLRAEDSLFEPGIEFEYRVDHDEDVARVWMPKDQLGDPVPIVAVSRMPVPEPSNIYYGQDLVRFRAILVRAQE